ncbi:MAG TPA: alpha/beta hydrolase [Acidimicrobiales bacterium]|jgi:pimeloyl-ACP methyl ester carboxylesterase|nr:alpha/beta hydrolase [Acidimicrobiales bacterium]
MKHPAGSLRVVHREPIADGPAAGRTLVLVHGAMDRATSFTRLMAKLPDWRILAYDRRGYGQSLEAGPPDGFDVQIDDLVSVVDGSPAVVFGHSLGGDVVLGALSRHPDLFDAALIWEAPQPWLAWWPADTSSRGAGSELEPEERAEWFMRRMVGDRIWDRLPQSTKDQRRAEGHTLAADMRSLTDGPLFDTARIHIPILIGRGGRSKAHQRRSARELADALPNGELVEIPDAGHGAHLSHPGEVADLIRRVAGVLIDDQS